MICYKKATLEELEALWDRDIAENPGDAHYLRWKRSFLHRNLTGRSATFLVLDGTSAIAQVTLDCYADSYSGDRAPLADGNSTAYVNSLRIDPEYKGKGHVSRLMETMERWTKEQGFTRLTVGAEAVQTRNLSIYFHWGYTDFVMAEENDGALVLFYSKKL